MVMISTIYREHTTMFQQSQLSSPDGACTELVEYRVTCDREEHKVVSFKARASYMFLP